jgi:hypothetical protein
VKVSEIPGFSEYKVTQGEFEGCVACNEMLLFKIPEDLYQDIMRYFHYELPLEEEEMLKANAENAVEGQDNNGRELGVVEGYDNIVKRVRPTTFA